MVKIVSRLEDRILEYFVFSVIVFFVKNAVANDSHVLLKCPNFNSAVACNQDCDRTGRVGFSVSGSEIELRKFEEDNVQKWNFNECNIENSYKWLCNKITYDKKNQMFHGYEIIQMMQGTFSQQSVVYNPVRKKWEEIFQCAKLGFKNESTEDFD